MSDHSKSSVIRLLNSLNYQHLGGPHRVSTFLMNLLAVVSATEESSGLCLEAADLLVDLVGRCLQSTD